MARAAVEVLDRIKEAGVDKEKWLRQLGEASGFTCDDSELLKAIPAYEAAHAQRIDIRSGEFMLMADGAGEQRHDVMSVSLDQELIKELSNFVAVAFEVFLSSVDGLILAKASADVGVKMVNAGVEKYIIRDMILTMSEDLGFTHRDILRLLAAYARYTDKGFKICVVESRANVTFVRGAKQMEGGKNSDPVVEELCRRIKELASKLGEHEKEKVRPKLSEEAVETLLSEEGPKWMEKLGAAPVRLFKDPKEPDGMKPIQ